MSLVLRLDWWCLWPQGCSLPVHFWNALEWLAFDMWFFGNSSLCSVFSCWNSACQKVTEKTRRCVNITASMESMAVSMLLAQTRLVPGTGTVLQGCLPTYQSGPAAGFLGLCLLVMLRLLQGIFTGGEIATVSTYITEVGNPRCCQEIKTFFFGLLGILFVLFARQQGYITVHSSHSFTRTNPNSWNVFVHFRGCVNGCHPRSQVHWLAP